MAKPPHTGGEMGVLYLICWRRNYPQATGTRPTSMILLDTDHLSLLQVRDAPAAFALHTRLEASPDAVVTTVITLEEQMRGRLALLHRVPEVARHVAYYVRLLRLVGFFPA